jgi:hypothetical protein
MADLMAARRRILMQTGDLLPPQYKPCDYIRTISHNAKFDSGVQGDDTTLVIEFDWKGSLGEATSWGSYYGMLGQLSVSGKQRWCIMRYTYASDPNATYLLTYAGTGVAKTLFPYGSGITFADKKMHFEIEYGKCTINGVSQESSSTDPLNDEHIYFGTTSPTSSGINKHYGYFWGIKMWSGGNLIRDYRPCIRLRDNKAGFYDLVNRTFNPSIGTANFVAGYDA